MPLKTVVKVGSLTNLSDARYCAGMDVQLLGFQAVSGLPNYITPARFQEIRGWIAGPSIVVEVHGIPAHSDINTIIEAYRPDYLEVGLAELPLIGNLAIPFIIRVRPGETLDNRGIGQAYTLVDIDDHRHFEAPRIVHVSSLEDALRAVKDEDVSGIALQGSEELSPGLKTYDTLAPILEMLEEA